MVAETVHLLPGQGGYRPGIFAGDSSPEVAEVLRIADQVAGEFGHGGVAAHLTSPDGPSAAELVRSDSFALQLAVFAAGVGSFRIATREQAAQLVVGHSMGEIAALTVAGAFELADGARLVCHRSRALSTHFPLPGGMVALELTASRTAHLVGAVDAPGLAVAVSNAPQQTVVSGTDEAVAKVARLAEALGVQATRLNAPFPFHSPLLALAAEAFTAEIGAIRQRPLRLAVYSPVAEAYLTDSADLKALLARQLTSPVRFLAAVRELHADGARHFVECGKAGLAGLVRRSVPDVTVSGTVGAPAAAAAIASAATPAVAPVTVAVAAPAAATPAADSGSVLEELRELYATTLGYPVEAITGDADLEADLGIDSLKRAEMLGKVTAHFGLLDHADDVRFIAQPTLTELAELITNTLAGGVQAPAVVAAPAAATPAADNGSVLEELRELYATTLGYPVEAITGDADLEADLGIDSLKRAEMLGKVTAHFGLLDHADDVRFIAQPTLTELAELITNTLAEAR
ncbi:acyltransferase domain-containing protein [Kitasatospora sp. McL0602]|uniref:ACP S-malonyltransferase n=1 Tax=Kitasatospora sp. McL0602 TaxID=3439530 RepID=UPI003F8A4CBB